MSPDPHAATNMEEEIYEIENRRGKRMLFTVLSAVIAVILLLVVVFGFQEHRRLRAEAARPQTEQIVLGTLVGQAANNAVFSGPAGLSYVDGVGDIEIGSSTAFARPLEYDAQGVPDEAPPGTTHWTLVEADSVPYIIEPVVNPLIGVSPEEYTPLALASLSREDYGAGGPGDWRLLELESEDITVSGNFEVVDNVLYLTSGESRVRLQGLEGLSTVDSLEVSWAIDNSEELSAYGRISTTPRSGDVMFVMTVIATHPPPAADETP